MKKIFNGKFIFRRVTGVERYGRETLLELDKIIKKDEYILVIPYGLKSDFISNLKNFLIIELKGYKNLFLWEQISLANYAKKENAIVVNFDFSNMLLYPGISTLHDVSYKVNKHFFNTNLKARLVKWKLELYGWCAKRSGNVIFTVSEFQKSEISKVYNVSSERIVVAPNAWQHYSLIKEDESFLSEIGIKEKTFYFSLSSNTPNKNFKWIYDVAKKNTDSLFVIAGGSSSISVDILRSMSNVIYLGYVSDEQIKALFKYCKAFIFPSFYEGFGIPPLEAMCTGADVIVSDIPCMREVYEKSAYYIDPFDANIDLDLLIDNNEVENSELILSKYSWKNTASIWKKVIDNI